MREFELLKHVFKANSQLPSQVTIAPGDDMGAIQLGEQTLLISVDQLADGVHFNWDVDDHTLVGRKAITRNLSDVAAMAALPIGCVACVALPKSMHASSADELFNVMRQVASQYQCPLMGGDVMLWDQRLQLSVTVLAQPKGVQPVLRQGAKVGDAIYVTGKLGGSLGGHHLKFEPRIALARLLAENKQTRPHCMIDLSDGLARDLKHLCDASHCDALIDADALPLRSTALTWENALGDGEDYELCFTAAANQSIPASLLGVPIKRIGKMIEKSQGLMIQFANSQPQCVGDLGWEHQSE